MFHISGFFQAFCLKIKKVELDLGRLFLLFICAFSCRQNWVFTGKPFLVALHKSCCCCPGQAGRIAWWHSAQGSSLPCAPLQWLLCCCQKEKGGTNWYLTAPTNKDLHKRFLMLRLAKVWPAALPICSAPSLWYDLNHPAFCLHEPLQEDRDLLAQWVVGYNCRGTWKAPLAVVFPVKRGGQVERELCSPPWVILITGLSGHVEFTFEALAHQELSSNHSLVGSNKVIPKRHPQKKTPLQTGLHKHGDAQGKSTRSLAEISAANDIFCGVRYQKVMGFFFQPAYFRPTITTAMVWLPCFNGTTTVLITLKYISGWNCPYGR